VEPSCNQIIEQQSELISVTETAEVEQSPHNVQKEVKELQPKAS